ncbi:MAG: hypothetical protein J7L72_04065 [Candidatus Aminicenantes bacterium]|nr:hypothetical protein [Candidatus Aminicenantes bacterium]HHF51732.1 hypothetical protein [Candidatus Aminicenantes bacterium]
MKRYSITLLLVGSIVFAIGGFVGFIILFIPDFNMYWLILSPIILAFYEAPAVLLYRLYKKHKKKNN